MADGRESIFFMETALVGCSCPSRQLYTQVHTGSTKWIQWILKEYVKSGRRNSGGGNGKSYKGGVALDFVKTHCIHVENSQTIKREHSTCKLFSC